MLVGLLMTHEYAPGSNNPWACDVLMHVPFRAAHSARGVHKQAQQVF
jgi:hypothetical protein